jgi:hypothetical protein
MDCCAGVKKDDRLPSHVNRSNLHVMGASMVDLRSLAAIGVCVWFSSLEGISVTGDGKRQPHTRRANGMSAST